MHVHVSIPNKSKYSVAMIFFYLIFNYFKPIIYLFIILYEWKDDSAIFFSSYPVNGKNTPKWACAELFESNGSVTYIKEDLRNAEYTKTC